MSECRAQSMEFMQGLLLPLQSACRLDQSTCLLFWFIEEQLWSLLFFAVMLSQRVGSDGGIMATLSLVTSWAQCALKIGKLILLKDYLPYVLEPFVASLVESALVHI